MKRLLLAPLLLGFIPSVNALPWSGDIVVKTDLDEKYVVKKTTVQVVDYSHNLLIKSLESQANEIKEKYRKCVSINGNKKDFVINSTIPNRSYCEKKYAIWNGEPNPYPTDISILKNQGKKDITLFKSVTFRPIFIDLNKKKTAGDYENVDCINPEIDVYSLSIADKYLKIRSNEPSKVSYIAYESMKAKVCEKYAKFQ